MNRRIDISEALMSGIHMTALTGLTISRFYSLISTLENALSTTEEAYTDLPQSELKLFFILFYLKHRPNHMLMAFLFRIALSRIEYWIIKLTPFIPKDLCTKNMKETSSIGELVDLVPEIVAICDEQHIADRPELLDCFIGKFLEERFQLTHS